MGLPPRSARIATRGYAIKGGFYETRYLDERGKTFLPLLVQHRLSPDSPSYYSQGYLHDKAFGKHDLTKLDAVNRSNIEAYLKNIQIMEKLTRLNTNQWQEIFETRALEILQAL